jgi:hypothetical protein
VGFFGWVFYCQPCLQPAAHQALQADQSQHLVQPPSTSRLLACQVFNGLCRERGGGMHEKHGKKNLMEHYERRKLKRVRQALVLKT